MKAIRTKYIPATNTKGSRISATTGEKGQRIIMSYDHSGKEHERAARALADKMGRKCDLIGGGFPDGTMVWVFADSPDRIERTTRTFSVGLTARERGAIGKHETEQRTYVVEASGFEQAREMAIARAHETENLEHVLVHWAKKVEG